MQAPFHHDFILSCHAFTSFTYYCLRNLAGKKGDEK